MPRISLTSYLFRIKSRSGKQYMKMGSYKENTDFLQTASEYLLALQNTSHINSKKQKIIGSAEIHTTNRLVCGTIKSGEYGFACDLYNTENCSISYHREVQDADLIPFYFLMEIPDDADEGIMIVQRFNQFGIKSLLSDFLKDKFKSEHADMMLDIHPLVPEQILNQFINDGRVIKINFTRFTLPSDIADAFDGHQHKEMNGTTELVVKTSRNGHFPILGRIKECVSKHRPLNQFIEIKNFEYDMVRIGVDFNGNLRTFDLSDLYKISPSLDVSAEVELKDGHPTFTSINTVAERFLDDLSKQIRGSSNNT